MKRTKIKFEDIKAGDLLEVVLVDNGVKSVLTGTAFKLEILWDGDERTHVYWATSEGGMVVNDEEGADIWRIDVTEVKFEDIREGDYIECSAKRGDVERIIRGHATYFRRSDASWYDGWETEHGDILIRRRSTDKIVILERAS